MSNQIAILGIGNLLKGDDGFGIACCNRLKALISPNIYCAPCEVEVTALMDIFESYKHVWIIDCVSHPTRPEGDILILDGLKEDLSVLSETVSSTHTFSLAQIISLAKQLQQVPNELIIYGVCGKNFTIGNSFGKQLADAMDLLLPQITKRIEQLGI